MPIQPQTAGPKEALNGDEENGNAQALLEQGLSLLDQARTAPSQDGRASDLFEQARTALEHARAAGADSLRVNLALAQSLLALNQPDQARLSVKRGIAEGDPTDEAYEMMETALAQLGNAGEWRVWGNELEQRYGNASYALRAYERAVEADPTDADAWLGGGRIHFREARWETALVWFGRMAERVNDPLGRAYARMMAGAVSIELSQHDEALEELAGAIRLSRPEPGMSQPEAEALEQRFAPLLGWVYYFTGAARVRLGRYSEALEDFERASGSDDPLRLFALQDGINVLWRQGEYATAWRRLAALPPRDRECSDAGYLDSYATLLRAQGKWDEAGAVYKMMGESAGDAAAGSLGLVMLNLDRREEDPIRADEWYLRARNSFERVERQITARLRMSATESEDLAALRRRLDDLLTLGPLLVEMRHHEKAKSHLVEAIRVCGQVGAPRHTFAVAHAYLGLAHAVSGKYSEAFVSLGEALNYDPDSLEYKVRLADVLTHLGLFDRSQRLYREVITRAPNNVDALIGLGEALTGFGDSQAKESDDGGGAGDPDVYHEAREQFTSALQVAKETRPDIAPQLRIGSRSLSAYERGGLYYSMGYASVKLHEAGARKGRLVPRILRPVAQARKDFERATKADPTHVQAARASRQLTRERANRTPKWAVSLLAAVCLFLLLAVQAAFYLKGHPNEIEKDAVTYAALTFGLLAFLLASLSLPELLKLRVGGVVLEKGPTESSDVGASLPITRGQSFTALSSGRLGVVQTLPSDTERPRAKPVVPGAEESHVKAVKEAGEEFSKPNSNGGPG